MFIPVFMSTTGWTVAPLYLGCKRDVRTLAMDSPFFITLLKCLFCVSEKQQELYLAHPTPYTQVDGSGRLYKWEVTVYKHIVSLVSYNKNLPRHSTRDIKCNRKSSSVCVWRWGWGLWVFPFRLWHGNRLDQALLLERELSLWYMYYLKLFSFFFKS